MTVDGLVEQHVERVALNEFFGGEDRWVEIRIMDPYAKAQIREETMRGLRFEPSTMSVGKGLDKAGPQVVGVPVVDGSADREMKVREIKLHKAVAKHNLTSGGAAAVWDKALWAALDNANPAILAKVLGAIEALNRGESDEDDEEPASPT